MLEILQLQLKDLNQEEEEREEHCEQSAERTSEDPEIEISIFSTMYIITVLIVPMNYVFHIFLRCVSAVGPCCLFYSCRGGKNTQCTGQGVVPQDAFFGNPV